MAYKVIDVSVWQGTIDWAKVKKDGVVGAIIRYADGTYLDTKFDYNMKNAKANGLHIGAYIYSRATTASAAQDEAKRLYNACKGYNPDLPLYIDLEYGAQAKYADTVAKAFLQKMDALGGLGGVYANLNWFNNYLTGTLATYPSKPMWIAQYNSKITHKNPALFGMWQYTSSGSVKGISGRVDMNHLYTAYWTKQTEPVKEPVSEKIAFDGWFGAASIRKAQEWLGTTADGIISGQDKDFLPHIPRIYEPQIEFGGTGSQMVRALQKKLGVTVTGVLNVETVKALQKMLGVVEDGYFGEATALQFQWYLNFVMANKSAGNQKAIDAACDWGVAVAGNDSFTYGTGDRAHHYGCFFCGTNPKKKGTSKQSGHTFDKTYCCNPFVHACFAHGAGDAKMLTACKDASGIGMTVSSFTRYGNWTKVDLPAKVADLKKGDVLVRSTHVALYIGNSECVEAVGEGWTAKSISVTSLTAAKLKKYEFVMRYSGKGRW